MNSVTRIVRVKPGHVVEVVAPQFKEGDEVEVVVSARTPQAEGAAPVLSFIDSLPDGPRAFATWEQYEKHLQDERVSRDRDDLEGEFIYVGQRPPSP